VTLTIRPPRPDELPGLSDLCLRSKAVWGYSAEFLAACRAELSFDPRDLEATAIAVAEQDEKLLGVAQVRLDQGEADLQKLFVEPFALRRGVGRVLLDWAIDVATEKGAARLTIESDPGAASFYRRMGAYDLGEAPSRSIPGRMLPLLAIDLAARLISGTDRR
jgi:GNAT superfamily N-acetyltransferase